MNVATMHRELDITLDKVDSSAYPEFLIGEKDYFLTEAQHRIVKTKYGGNNVYRTGFEQSQKRSDDIKNLVVSRFAQVSVSPHYVEVGDNIYKADLNSLFTSEDLSTVSDSEYMFYIKSAAKTCYISKANCCGYHKVKLVQQDDISSISGDPFNKPTPERPIIFFEDGGILIWGGKDATIESFMVTFIRRPKDINLGGYDGPEQDCELSEHVHKEIVQLAARIALESIESPRQQTQEGLNVRQQE